MGADNTYGETNFNSDTVVQEYRKASAEALGFTNSWSADGYKWQPDKDANQREMIEDWLIEQGCGLQYQYDIYDDNEWSIIIDGDDGGYGIDKSKSPAFMKAFMEYITNKLK